MMEAPAVAPGTPDACAVPIAPIPIAVRAQDEFEDFENVHTLTGPLKAMHRELDGLPKMKAAEIESVLLRVFVGQLLALSEEKFQSTMRLTVSGSSPPPSALLISFLGAVYTELTAQDDSTALPVPVELCAWTPEASYPRIAAHKCLFPLDPATPVKQAAQDMLNVKSLVESFQKIMDELGCEPIDALCDAKAMEAGARGLRSFSLQHAHGILNEKTQFCLRDIKPDISFVQDTWMVLLSPSFSPGALLPLLEREGFLVPPPTVPESWV
jgi:hypothetical protein